MRLMETAAWVSMFGNVCVLGGECSVGVSEQVAGVTSQFQCVYFEITIVS